MKIPFAKLGERFTICTHLTGFTIPLVTGRALTKNPDPDILNGSGICIKCKFQKPDFF